MNKLLILASDETPQILFDPSRGILDISGRSLPEDITEFYTPLEDAVKVYIGKPQPVTTINFDLTYLNSASTKRVLEIITLFEAIYRKGSKIVFNWYHDEFDEDMREEGEEFARLTEIPIKIISKSSK